jgi:hypothetical protein
MQEENEEEGRVREMGKVRPENMTGRDLFSVHGVHNRILLKSLMKKYGMNVRTGLSWLNLRNNCLVLVKPK